MPQSSQAVEAAQSLIRDRLAEIDVERTRLERALAELRGKRRGPGRPPIAKPQGRGGRKLKKAGKGRKRRSGGRADQAVSLIAKTPGITANDLAKQLKIKPNYLYRVLGDLEKEKRVDKKGRQYFPSKEKG